MNVSTPKVHRRQSAQNSSTPLCILSRLPSAAELCVKIIYIDVGRLIRLLVRGCRPIASVAVKSVVRPLNWVSAMRPDAPSFPLLHPLNLVITILYFIDGRECVGLHSEPVLYGQRLAGNI